MKTTKKPIAYSVLRINWQERNLTQWDMSKDHKKLTLDLASSKLLSKTPIKSLREIALDSGQVLSKVFLERDLAIQDLQASKILFRKKLLEFRYSLHKNSKSKLKTQMIKVWKLFRTPWQIMRMTSIIFSLFKRQSRATLSHLAPQLANLKYRTGSLRWLS